MSNRTTVPAPSTSPSCSADSPRALRKAGRKGEATPKAAYIAAYSSMNRGNAVDRRSSPASLRSKTTGALLDGHRGQQAQIRGLIRQDEGSVPRDRLVTTVRPGTPSARVILRRAALGQTESHPCAAGGRAVGAGRPWSTRQGQHPQDARRPCPYAEKYGRARQSAPAAVQRRGQGFEGHDQIHGRQHRHAASRQRSHTDTARRTPRQPPFPS